MWNIPLNGCPPQRLPITDAWVTYPSLARNGDTLIYKNYEDVVDLRTVELSATGTPIGDPVQAVPSIRSEIHPRMSSVDDRLAFLTNRTGAFEVWSGTPDKLIRNSSLEGLVPGLVDWGPACRRLVFDAHRQGQSDLFLVDTEGRTPRDLTHVEFNEVNPRFAANGHTLYYDSDRSGF